MTIPNDPKSLEFRILVIGIYFLFVICDAAGLNLELISLRIRHLWTKNSLVRIGAEKVEETDGTLRLACGAGFPSEENQPQGKIAPFLAGDNLHQVKLDFDRIAVLGESQAP